MKWYGYLGLLLIAFAEINFSLKIEPFATFYIPIVWYGYILFVDSLVYYLKKKSLVTAYPKELLFIMLLSVPFWLIFELYNLYTGSWIYINYNWYVHIIDFTTIMPAVLETFTLFSALEFGRRFDIKKKFGQLKNHASTNAYIIKLFVIIGFLLLFVPFVMPSIGFPIMWIGLFVFLDPLNYLLGRSSISAMLAQGRKRPLLQLFASGLTMGFFWEFWNYQALPMWIYTFANSVFLPKLFEMPIPGYLGYLPFALEVYLFLAFFRPFVFKKKNDLLLM